MACSRLDEYRWVELDQSYKSQVKSLFQKRAWSYQEAKWDYLFSRREQFGLMHRGTLVATGGLHSAKGAALVIMILVDPEHAGRGLGRMVTREALKRAGERPCYLYATEMGQGLYEGLGFRARERTYLYHGVFPIQTEAEAEIGEGCFEELVTLDKQAYGESRELLLKSLWDRRYRCCLARLRGRVTGGTLSFWEDEQLVVGPLLGSAPETCQRLVEETTDGQRANVCFTESHHCSLQPWLCGNSAKLLQSEPLMAQASWSPPDNWNLVAAIPSFAYG